MMTAFTSEKRVSSDFYTVKRSINLEFGVGTAGCTMTHILWPSAEQRQFNIVYGSL